VGDAEAQAVDRGRTAVALAELGDLDHGSRSTIRVGSETCVISSSPATIVPYPSRRPRRLCSISTGPTRASRTAAARRRSVPCTTKSFPVVRTTSVRSHRHTARTTIAAASTRSTTPPIVAGQPTTRAAIPGAARTDARRNDPTSTIPCRRSFIQTCSRAETTGFQDSSQRGQLLSHGGGTAKRTASATLVVVGIVAGALALWKLKLVIALVFLGVIIAAALRSGIDGLQRRGVPRGLGLLLHYVAIFGFVALLLWFAVPRALHQVETALGTNGLPTKASDLQQAANHSQGIKHSI